MRNTIRRCVLSTRRTRDFCARGADYFILGCTELPLAAEALQLTQPTIDPTAELAKAAITFCGYRWKV